MRNLSFKIMAAGMALAIFLSDICSFVGDGKELEELRGNVLRLHILANSDSDYDQNLKLMVRDELLKRENEIFSGAESFQQAEELAYDKLDVIEEIADGVLAENGCSLRTSAKITEMYFDERTYGDITMPAGNYTALRIEIGEAQGHNWWCVMYPPLCIPAACGSSVGDDKETEEEFFDEQQQDILYHPVKYRVRFAMWDKFKEIFKL